MAPNDTLIGLIRSGKLTVGTTLSHAGRIHKSRSVTAKVSEQGISFRGRTYSSPSGAARAITGIPVDGWRFWKLPGGKNLDTLR
jgi:hypothetical protein